MANSSLFFTSKCCTCLISTQIRKRGLCAYDDKRYLLADGITTLAFGHTAIPAAVREVQETRGFDKQVLSSAEARTRQIPLAKKRQLPAGQEPGECVNEARRVAIASIAPATTAASSTAASPTAASTTAASTTAATRPRRILDMDPDGPDALSQEDFFRFMLNNDD